MPAVETRYEHIVLDEKQVPIIAGTTMKVVELAAEKVAYGWGAEEMKIQHPYLTLGQIYSALAYYADHREEVDENIDHRLAEVDRLEKELGQPPFLVLLREKGLLPSLPSILLVPSVP